MGAVLIGSGRVGSDRSEGTKSGGDGIMPGTFFKIALVCSAVALNGFLLLSHDILAFMRVEVDEGKVRALTSDANERDHGRSIIFPPKNRKGGVRDGCQMYLCRPGRVG